MKKDHLAWLLGTAIYFLWFGGLVGLRVEHVGVWVLAVFAWFYGPKSRDFLINAVPWVLFWLLYDSLRIAPNYSFQAVHIQDLYDFDKKWFGITAEDGQLLTLNEWFARHYLAVLDLLAGAFYISWVPLPAAFAIWLYLRDREVFWQYSWCFLTVNLIGVTIYYAFPAAPPWYVANYGFGFDPTVARSAAGLARVDEVLDITLFKTMYSRNSSMFAAMPSLHSAYPMVAFLYALKSKRRWAISLFAITSMGIWLSAVYTGHHYVLDVLAGIAVALFGFFIFDRFLKTRLLKWLQKAA